MRRPRRFASCLGGDQEPGGQQEAECGQEPPGGRQGCVQGRAVGADTVTVTKNEILTALNQPDQYILAIVPVGGVAAAPRYVRAPFIREPDFGVTSVNYQLAGLLARAEDPA